MVDCRPVEERMKKKRNRKRPPQSFQERLRLYIQQLREAAGGLPAGDERRALLLKVRDAEAPLFDKVCCSHIWF
jgi:hypothetical protein